jgi:hypothetical protein
MESSLPLGEFKDNSLTMPFILILNDAFYLNINR